MGYWVMVNGIGFRRKEDTNNTNTMLIITLIINKYNDKNISNNKNNKY